MPQEQSHKSGDPPIGRCVVCEEPVTIEDPGKLQVSAATGSMAHVHDRCRVSSR